MPIVRLTAQTQNEIGNKAIYSVSEKEIGEALQDVTSVGVETGASVVTQGA